MEGLNLNRPIRYRRASFRYFAPGERHITRICEHDVLLLVTEGCLRFSENGHPREIFEGEYYIQKRGDRHRGDFPSDSPKYLYVHFEGEWGTEVSFLPRRGTFSVKNLLPLLLRLDEACHRGGVLTEQLSIFYHILTVLRPNEQPDPDIGNNICEYIREHRFEPITLKELSRKFDYSQNQIINIVRKSYGCSPLQYLHRQRVEHGAWLLRVTSKSLGEISAECGYGEYSQFYRQFVKVYKISPGQWRTSHRF